MKKIIPVVLAFAMLLCFAACGETETNTPSDSSTATPTESSTPADTSTSKPDETESTDDSQSTETTSPDSTVNNFSAGLQYTQSTDKTSYTVGGIGTCKDADIVIPSVNEGLPVVGIDKMAFHECVNLNSIEIADSITTIGEWSFYTCTNLKSITIPSGLISIDERAFYYCTSLEEIHYNGTKEQWGTISKGESWNDNTGAYTIFCTDGEITK